MYTINTNFFHATETSSFFKKRNKIKLLYKSLSWFKEKKWKNKLKNLEKKLKRKQNIFVRLERKNWKTKRNKQTLKKNYTQRKIFHNMLYEHKICMQNAAFLMCLIEACNTKKNQCHTPFSLQGSSMYDVTTFSSNCSTPPWPSHIKQLFSLIPGGGVMKVVT